MNIGAASLGADADWAAQTLAMLRASQYQLLPSSVATIVQHALAPPQGSDLSKTALIALLIDSCVLDPNMPKGILLSVLAPVIDTLAFLLADPSPAVTKRAIQAATAFYPVAFETIATIPLVDASIWVKLTQLKAAVISCWQSAKNDGVKVHVVKFLQMLALVQSQNPNAVPGEITLSLCPPNHPYLVLADLQRESLEAFAQLLAILTDTNCSGALMTASVNALFPIIRARPIYTAPALECMISWIRSPPSHLSPLQAKNVTRAIRNEFLAILSLSASTKLPETTQFIPTITEILINQGVKGYEISTRVKARDMGKKVLLDELQQQESGLIPPVQTAPVALAQSSQHPTASTQHNVMNLHAASVSHLPLDTVVEAVTQGLLAVSNEAWVAGLAKFAEALRVLERDRPSTTGALGSQLNRLAPPPSAMPTVIPQQEEEPEFDPATIEVAQLSLEDRVTTWKDAVLRVLETEPLFEYSSNAGAAPTSLSAGDAASLQSTMNPAESLLAARTGWMLLLIRLCMEPPNFESADGEWITAISELREKLFEFIVERFRIRYELAILWLHEEYRVALKSSRKNKRRKISDEIAATVDEKEFASYQSLFHKILASLKGEVKSDKENTTAGLDRTFTKFLIDAPMVPIKALSNAVKEYCEDSQRMLLGLSTLRDLVNLRPAMRHVCLGILLDYCTVSDKILRSNAILVARRWISDHSTVGPIVESHAYSMLQKLCGPPDGDEDGGAAWEEIDCIRHFELFLSVTSKKPALMNSLLETFSKFVPEAASAIVAHIEPLVRSLAGSGHLIAVLDAVRVFPEGSGVLGRKIVDVLTDKEVIEREVVETVVEMSSAHDLDGSWLLRVVSGLNKHQVLQFLPKFISLLDGSEEREVLVEQGLIKILTLESQAAASAEAAVGSRKQNVVDRRLTPADILIAIHNLEGTIDLKMCLEGTKLCIKHPEIFKQESLAIAIQQLVEQQKIPTLFMRTVLESIKLYPGLSAFINGILTRLISKRVWVNSNLWKGFVICCKLTAPTSFSVIITLPKPQLEDILVREPSLKPRLYEYVTGLPSAMRLRAKNLMQLLQEEVAQPPSPLQRHHQQQLV
ncbi:hypothetical protein HDU82_004582 [Entophlyctis luteolus]|nr:hypothetical protein HDU82_004582 [Entophlyctis luteolus]